MKYCVDCKNFKKDYPPNLIWIPVIGHTVLLLYIIYNNHIKYGKCKLAIKNGNGDSYLSPNFSNYQYASVVRKYGDECDSDGKSFEPKEKVNVIDTIKKACVS